MSYFARHLVIIAALSTALSCQSVAAQTDVTVVAPAPRDWRSALIVGEAGAHQCRVIASTGDDGIDAQGCAMLWQCFDETKAQFLVAADRRLPKRTRGRLLTAAQNDLDLCFRQRRRLTSYRATPDGDTNASAQPAAKPY